MFLRRVLLLRTRNMTITIIMINITTPKIATMIYIIDSSSSLGFGGGNLLLCVVEGKVDVVIVVSVTLLSVVLSAILQSTEGSEGKVQRPVIFFVSHFQHRQSIQVMYFFFLRQPVKQKSGSVFALIHFMFIYNLRH